MTFQIGMVGEDGVLLASDRAYTRLGSGTRTALSSQKLIITPAENIAYCCAGDDFTQMVADDICRLPKPPSVRATREFLLLSLPGPYMRATETWKTGGSILLAYGIGGPLGACPRNHFMSHMLCAYKTPTTSNCGYDMPILNTRTRS